MNKQRKKYIRLYMRKYYKTSKHKAYRHQYWQSKLGKTALKKYAQSKKGKKSHYKRNARYYLRFPNKIKAYEAVRRAIKTGKLTHPSKRYCGYCCSYPAAKYRHYLGYAKEHRLDVAPVC